MAVVKRVRKVRGATDRRTARSRQTAATWNTQAEDGPKKRRHANRCWVISDKSRFAARRECGTFLNSMLVLFNTLNAAHNAFHTRLCVTWLPMCYSRTMNREAVLVWRGFYAIRFLRRCQLKPFSNIEVEAFLSCFFFFFLQHCVTGANKIGWKINPCPSEKPSNASDLNTGGLQKTLLSFCNNCSAMSATKENGWSVYRHRSSTRASVCSSRSGRWVCKWIQCSQRQWMNLNNGNKKENRLTCLQVYMTEVAGTMV